jgi:hypothetical protein
MMQSRAKLFAVAVVLVALSINTAHAVPPTATPSPGYDARLQEQRAASRAYEPVAPVTKKPAPRRSKRTVPN